MEPGELLAGRFRVEREAGAGGMGRVYRARDERSGAIVAVKVLFDDADPARFEREASVLAGISHPGVVRYIEHGVTDAGARYLVMEWLEGEVLAERLDAVGALALDEAVAVVRAAAEALAAAHARGVVHRDIKPGNLFLEASGAARVKVLDFGVARPLRERRALTRTGALVGTPEYMAPEQARGGRAIDARADVFALGCVLFECVTGRAAFVGDNLMATLARILLEDAPRVRSLRPDAPAALDALVARMLARDPEARPRDAADVVRALDALGDAVAPTGPAQDAPAALTSLEQRLVCIVLAGSGLAATTDDELSTGATLAQRWDDARVAELREAVRRYDARLEPLADGAVIAMLAGAGAATDLAARAAQTALALAPRLPGVPVVVAAGRGVVSEAQPAGEAIDRAARMLALASATSGAVRIDATTAELLDPRFDVAGEGPVRELRGEREGGPPVRSMPGHELPLVGRDRELAMLEATFVECVDEPVARAVVVTGAAGAGKSRLVSEFIRRARAREPATRPLPFLVRCEPSTAATPLAALGRMLRQTAGVTPEQPPEARRARLLARVQRALAEPAATRVAAVLGEVAGAPFPDADAVVGRNDPALRAENLRGAFGELLEAECARGPVMLVLDQLQWCDAATVALIDGALGRLRERPLMVLATARPELRSEFPELWSAHDAQEVRLGALTRKASEKLARAALGDGADGAVVARLVERAEGNPFYLEELVRAVRAGTSPDALPDGVLGTVQARLDALDERSRRVLRAASVFGMRFSRDAVAALLGGDAGLDARLAELVAREVLLPVDGAPGAFDFRHGLLRDAAYATLTDADRALGHRLAARWLEERDDVGEGALAEHYERGGLAERAASGYLRAARHALGANDAAAADGWAARGLSLRPARELAAGLELVRAEVSFWRGEYAAMASQLEAIQQDLAPGSDDWFTAATGLISAAGYRGEPARVRAGVERLLAMEPAPGSVSARVLALSRSVAMAGHAAIAPSLARAMRDQALAHERDPSLSPLARAHLAQLRADSLPSHRPVERMRALRAACALSDAVGDGRAAAYVRIALGAAQLALGLHADAEASLREALAHTERGGLAQVGALSRLMLARLQAIRGERDEARALFERSVATARATGALANEARAALRLAEAELSWGAPADAEREARAVLGDVTDVHSIRAEALAVLARALAAQGRGEPALTAAREAFDEREACSDEVVSSFQRDGAFFSLAMVEALQGAGRTDEARSELARACDQLRAFGAAVTEDGGTAELALVATLERIRLLELERAWSTHEVSPARP